MCNVNTGQISCKRDIYGHSCFCGWPKNLPGFSGKLASKRREFFPCWNINSTHSQVQTDGKILVRCDGEKNLRPTQSFWFSLEFINFAVTPTWAWARCRHVPQASRGAPGWSRRRKCCRPPRRPAPPVSAGARPWPGRCSPCTRGCAADRCPAALAPCAGSAWSGGSSRRPFAECLSKHTEAKLMLF